jgi:hypothetical protein
MATGLSLSSTGTGSTALSNGQRILIAAAVDAFEPAAPNPDLIRSERIPQGTKQWEINTYARLSSASALTEGVDLSQSQQLAVNTLEITPAEHGIIATVSKPLIRRQGDKAVLPGVGAMLGASLRRRQDLDVIALYDGFSKSTPGTGTGLDITHFRGAAAYLGTDNDSDYGPAPMPYYAALHIEQISDLIVDLTDTAPRGTTTGLTDDIIQRWWRAADRLYGVQIFHAGNIARSGNDAKGAIFNPDALVMVMATEAEATEQTDESARMIELGVFQEWSEGERADAHGVEIFSDAAATI